MEKYIDVMKETTVLLETVQEGLAHIQALLKQGKGEASITLFSNVVQAFSSMEQSVFQLPEELQPEEIMTRTEKVRHALDTTVEAYEAKEYVRVLEVMQFTLLPAFNRWNEALDQTFRPYVVS
ncbi:hypothetical protein EU245_13265 [Lentibacillus lipolyticus]|nr:hypothetical protein EU245_13265 [Lentibacillus lipolyticus]